MYLKCKYIATTSAKDNFVKFWDLDTQHCFRTLVGHRTEVWDFVLARDETWLVTGSADMEIRVWLVKYTKQVSIYYNPKCTVVQIRAVNYLRSLLQLFLGRG